MGVREAAAALGLKPRQLKNALSAGRLPPARRDPPGVGFALASFDVSWLRESLLAMDQRPKEIREAPYVRRVIKVPPAPGVEKVDPGRVTPSDTDTPENAG
jgi:hypothetical protein